MWGLRDGHGWDTASTICRDQLCSWLFLMTTCTRSTSSIGCAPPPNAPTLPPPRQDHQNGTACRSSTHRRDASHGGLENKTTTRTGFRIIRRQHCRENHQCSRQWPCRQCKTTSSRPKNWPCRSAHWFRTPPSPIRNTSPRRGKMQESTF